MMLALVILKNILSIVGCFCSGLSLHCTRCQVGTYAAGQPTPPVSMHLSFAGTPLTLRNVNLLEKDCLG